MDTPDQNLPDWSLLPHDPRGFFGLAEGFDQKSLKRAYTALLKRFKPETHAQEFQSLRAAYETLEQGLRQFGPAFAMRIRPAPDTDDDESYEFVARARPSVDPLIALEAGGPQAALRTLRELPQRSAPSWMHLALLEEELDSADPLAFERTLLKGMRETRGDLGLQFLLRSSLSEGDDLDLALTALTLVADACAESASDPTGYCFDFWSVSDPLWDLLMRSGDFAKFRATFEVQRARFGQQHGFPVFLLRALRRSRFMADPGWVAETRDWLVEHMDLLPPFLCEEFDRDEWLSAYAGDRRAFLDGSPARARVDRALCAILAGEGLRSEQEFLELQVAHLEAPAELLSGFPVGTSVPDSVLQTLEWYGDSLASTRAPRRPTDARRTSREVGGLMLRLSRRTRWSPTGWIWGLATFLYALVLLLAIAWPAAWGLLYLQAGQFELAFLNACGLLLVAQLMFCGATKRWERRLTIPFARRLYRRAWRREVMGVLERCNLKVDELSSVLSQVSAGSSLRPQLLDCIESDPAVRLYGLAQGFAE